MNRGEGEQAGAGEEGSEAEQTVSAEEHRRDYQGKCCGGRRGGKPGMVSTHTARKGELISFFEVAGVAPAGLCCPALLLQLQVKDSQRT